MADAAALWQLPSVLPSASPRACSWVAAVGIGIHRAGKVRHASAQQEAETDDSGQDGNVEGGSNEGRNDNNSRGGNDGACEDGGSGGGVSRPPGDVSEAAPAAE